MKIKFSLFIAIMWFGLNLHSTYGQIAVNEIQFSHYSPRYSGAADEYVVLFNNSSHSIDLNGYEIVYASNNGTQSIKKQWTSSVIIPARKYFLCSSNASVTVGSVSGKLADAVFAMGFADASQLAFRKTSGGTIIYAIATGVINTFTFGSTTTHTVTTSSGSPGAFQLTPNINIDSTYIRTGDNNSDYSLINAASITDVPNSGDNALPVELTSFTSTVNDRQPQLMWTTASEINNAGFDVMRKEKKEGAEWTLAGAVRGHGTTNEPHDYVFVDSRLNTGVYEYKLVQRDYNGNIENYLLNEDIVIGTPKNFDLEQNFPNPFNPTTHISFTLPERQIITFKVYDILGQELLNKTVSEWKDAGFHTITFNVDGLSSGIYFYSLSYGTTKTIVKKMTIVK